MITHAKRLLALMMTLALDPPGFAATTNPARASNGAHEAAIFPTATQGQFEPETAELNAFAAGAITVERTPVVVRIQRNNPAVSRAQALQRAARAVREDSADPTLAHPRSWAPFSLVGDNG